MLARTTILEENKIKIIIPLIFIKLYLLFSYISNHFLALSYFSLKRLLHFLAKFKLNSISSHNCLRPSIRQGGLAEHSPTGCFFLEQWLWAHSRVTPYSITSIMCTIIYNNIIKHILHQPLPPSCIHHRFGAILTSEIEKGNLDLSFSTNYPCQHACSARKELLVLGRSDHFSAHQSC